MRGVYSEHHITKENSKPQVSYLPFADKVNQRKVFQQVDQEKRQASSNLFGLKKENELDIFVGFDEIFDWQKHLSNTRKAKTKHSQKNPNKSQIDRNQLLLFNLEQLNNIGSGNHPDNPDVIRQPFVLGLENRNRRHLLEKNLTFDCKVDKRRYKSTGRGGMGGMSGGNNAGAAAQRFKGSRGTKQETTKGTALGRSGSQVPRQ